MTDYDTKANDPTYDGERGAVAAVRKACANMKRPDLFRRYMDSIDRRDATELRLRAFQVGVQVQLHRTIVEALGVMSVEQLLTAMKSAAAEHSYRDDTSGVLRGMLLHAEAVTRGMTELALREYESVEAWMKHNGIDGAKL